MYGICYAAHPLYTHPAYPKHPLCGPLFRADALPELKRHLSLECAIEGLIEARYDADVTNCRSREIRLCSFLTQVTVWPTSCYEEVLSPIDLRVSEVTFW